MEGTLDGAPEGCMVVAVVVAVDVTVDVAVVDTRRSSVVAPSTACRSSQLVNMWQYPLAPSTSALHSSCDKHASTHSVMVR